MAESSRPVTPTLEEKVTRCAAHHAAVAPEDTNPFILLGILLHQVEAMTEKVNGLCEAVNEQGHALRAMKDRLDGIDTHIDGTIRIITKLADGLRANSEAFDAITNRIG